MADFALCSPALDGVWKHRPLDIKSASSDTGLELYDCSSNRHCASRLVPLTVRGNKAVGTHAITCASYFQ